MKNIKLKLLVFTFTIVGCLNSSDNKTPQVSKTPEREIGWTTASSFLEWDQTSDGFFGISDTNLLLSWTWEKTLLVENKPIKLPAIQHFVPLSGKQYIGVLDDSNSPLVISTLGMNEENNIKKWELPSGWNYKDIGVSRNRMFAALMISDFRVKMDSSIEGRYVRLITISTGEISTVFEHHGEIYGMPGPPAVSEDGNYIALMGWNNGIALVDSRAKEIQWFSKPKDSVSILNAIFSSDGLTLYALDHGGGSVFAFETQTGKVLRQWYATETGQSIYGHRISCFALSPDEAWIAAGTGPEGQVFLFNTTFPNSKPILLPHGLTTTLIVSFSPDSKWLASVAGGVIKVWAVQP
jgi:WD40 repeat protein